MGAEPCLWVWQLLQRRRLLLPVDDRGVLELDAVVRLCTAVRWHGHPHVLGGAAVGDVDKVEVGVGGRPHVERFAHDLPDALARRKVEPALREEEGCRLLLDKQRMEGGAKVGSERPAHKWPLMAKAVRRLHRGRHVHQVGLHCSTRAGPDSPA